MDKEQYRGFQFQSVYKEPDGTALGGDWTIPATAGTTPYVPAGLPAGNLEDWNVYRVVVAEGRTLRGSAANRRVFRYDGYGNQTDAYDYLAAADAGWYRHAKAFFYPLDDGTHYVVGKPAAAYSYRYDASNPNGDGIWVSGTLYCYDNSTKYDQAIGAGVNGDDGSFRGQLTRVRRVLSLTPGQEQLAEAAFAYDAYGNQTQATVFGGYGTWTGVATADPRTTTTVYDGTYHSFPLSVTNPLGHAAQATFDAATGKPLTITDANGQVVSLAYDGFKRLTQALGPMVGTSYRKELLFTYDNAPTVTNGRYTAKVKTRRRTDDGGAAQYFNAWSFYDGAGRLVQRYADGVGGVTVVNRLYEGRGLLAQETAPHLNTSTPGGFADGDWIDQANQPRTLYAYDGLRRIRSTTTPEGFVVQSVYWG